MSENVLRTVSALPFIFDVTVGSTSGVITTPAEGLAREVLPRITGVNILHGVNTGTPFVVPPALDIERPVMQLHDFLTYRMPESRQSSLLLSLSASSSALTLPRNPAKFSSSSFSLDRVPPLRGNKSLPVGEALLQPPADDCVVSDVDVPNTAVWCEPFPGSEYPSVLPACAMVRAVLPAGPSGAPDWVGCQDLYDTARGIIDLCECLIFVRPLRRDDFPIRGTGRDDTSSPRYAQILRVRRSAVYSWKPGIWVAAASFSVPGRRMMSGVTPAPVWRVAVQVRTISTVPEELVYLGVIELWKWFVILQFLYLICHKLELLCRTFHAGG